MKKLQHTNHSQKKILSFTIIPSTTNKVIHFSIPYWSIFSFIGVFLCISLYSIGVSKNLSQTQEQLLITTNNLTILSSQNHAQTIEIDYLKGRSEEIEEKLIALNDLQTKVLSMVGLEDPLEEQQAANPLTVLVSRSDNRIPVVDHNYDLEEDIILLDNLIEQQTMNFEKLVVDVEKQLQYIDSLPNLRPAIGRVSSNFGYRLSPTSRNREFHSGIDIANKTNTDIVAAGSGVVTFSGYNGAYGRMIIISHGYGYTSVYAHNNTNLVKVGDHVAKGDVIAKMGSTGRSTGPHVHFEIRLNGKVINPNTVLEN
ncbi:M23 family metallopeptidase [Alkaliphilus transvaalensis]|uniref:M23 family metallopeptidase n=1 Tax=Alkaliphilus transvaalensis TaxID=114628 RepID=UPI0006872352|nr:M23 family metallopeptidase [Alkaliphilus transvaalensis]